MNMPEYLRQKFAVADLRVTRYQKALRAMLPRGLSEPERHAAALRYVEMCTAYADAQFAGPRAEWEALQAKEAGPRAS